MHLASAAHIKRAKEHDPSSQSGTVKEGLRRVGLQTLITAAARTVYIKSDGSRVGGGTGHLVSSNSVQTLDHVLKVKDGGLNPKPYNPKPLR